MSKRRLRWEFKVFQSTADNTSMIGDCYAETLGMAIDMVIADFDRNRAVLEDPGAAREKLADEPVNYGCTLRKSFPLTSYKGKPTKRYGHVNIYRMPSGRYEVNTYVL